MAPLPFGRLKEGQCGQSKQTASCLLPPLLFLWLGLVGTAACLDLGELQTPFASVYCHVCKLKWEDPSEI